MLPQTGKKGKESDVGLDILAGVLYGCDEPSGRAEERREDDVVEGEHRMAKK